MGHDDEAAHPGHHGHHEHHEPREERVERAEHDGRRRRGPARRVEVVGAGEAAGAPDVVRLRLSLHRVAPDVATALELTGALVTAAGAAVREAGVADADIVSTGAHVGQRWDHRTERHEGYEATHRLTVVVRDLARLDPVVAAVAGVAGDGLGIDDISLDLADAGPLRAQARAAAFADARAKAEQYAALAGARLGEVLAVVEGGVPALRRGRAGGEAMAFAAAGPSMPVEGGQYSVTAGVTVAFALVAGPDTDLAGDDASE